MLKLHPNFNMRAFEAFVTVEVVDEEVVEVEEEVVATQGEASKAVRVEAGGSTRLLDVIEVEDTGDS